MRQSAPPGVHAGTILKRFADSAPSSYDAEARTVDAVLSRGSPVARFYGVEVLRISPDAVDLDRMKSSGIPLLDSHQGVGITNALGRLKTTSFARGALLGTFAFNDTPQGRVAEGMVERGEICGVSVGYAVREWQVSDEDGRIINPETQRINFDDNLTFTAMRWELNECSLVSVPADANAIIRSLGSGLDRLPFSNALDQIVAADTIARMNARYRMTVRARMVAAMSGERR